MSGISEAVKVWGVEVTWRKPYEAGKQKQKSCHIVLKLKEPSTTALFFFFFWAEETSSQYLTHDVLQKGKTLKCSITN